jgi:hypothetical protein
MYDTIIQAAPTSLLAGITSFCQVIQGLSSLSIDYVTLRNFTVDCNWPALAASADSGAGSFTVFDGQITAGSPVLSSSSANSGDGFSSADLSRTLSGGGIPVGTTIVSIQDSTHVVMSAPATATTTAGSITVGGEKHISVYGVLLTGNYNLVENVRCINQYGSRANGNEAFGIVIQTTAFADATGNTIRGCRGELPQGNYGSAFNLFGWVSVGTNYPDRYMTNSVIQNCTAVGVNNGLSWHLAGYTTGAGGFANAKSCQFLNNTFVDCVGAFYCDTGSLEDILIANNVVTRGWECIALVTDHPDWQWTKKHITIRDNNVNIQNRLEGNGCANYGIWVTGASLSSDVTISGNYFSCDPSGRGYEQFLTISCDNMQTASVTNNTADEASAGNALAAPVRGQVTNSTNVSISLNRTTTGAQMTGLADH